MNRPICQLILIQFKEFIRQPGVLFWALGFPILMAWILGLAFSNQDQITYRIAVVAPSEKLRGKLAGFCEQRNSYRNLECVQVKNTQKAYQLIREGQVSLFVKRNTQTDPDGIDVYFDPQSGEAEKIYLFLKGIWNSDPGSAKKTEPVNPKTIQSKGNRYIDFLVPGLIALTILNSCFWGVGWGLIELRVKKLLRRMIATPMSRFDFMLSFAFVRIFLGVFEFFILYGFAYYYFDVTVQGSWAGLLLIFIVGNISFTGMSILAASRPNNTRIGNGVLNAITIPMTILSGIFFSYHSLPDFAVWVIQLMPLTTLADALRSLFNEGSTLLDMIRPAVILTLEGIVSFVLGIRFFKWQ